MVKNQTVKRGYLLKFEEELTPNEVSALGKRLEFHIGFMAISIGSGRMDKAQDQAKKILEITKAMQSKGEYQI